MAPIRARRRPIPRYGVRGVVKLDVLGLAPKIHEGIDLVRRVDTLKALHPSVIREGSCNRQVLPSCQIEKLWSKVYQSRAKKA